MYKISKIVSLLIVVSIALGAVESQGSYIVLTSSTKSQKIKRLAHRLGKTYPDIPTQIKKIEKWYVLELGPFDDPQTLTLQYLKLRKKFPQAYIQQPPLVEKEIVTKEKIVEKPVLVEKALYVEKEDPTLWTALFGLGIIGILALFLSSHQIQQMKQRYLRMQKRQDEIEQKQSFLLEKMGEQIQDVTIKSIQEEQKLLDNNLNKTDIKELKTHIEYLKEQDEELLRTTYEMIDFLKIKSGNIVIKEEPFQLSNMLHKLTNAVAGLLQIRTRSLSYDITQNVPRYIVGDSVRIYQVIYNLVAHSLEHTLDANVVVKMEISEDGKILFKISNRGQVMDQEEIDKLFIPSSWEELQESATPYSFFVTNELVARMHGKLEIESTAKEGTVYRWELPYIEDEHHQSKRALLERKLKEKKVLLVDDSRESARILRKILESFGMHVSFMEAQEFQKTKPSVKDLEMIVLRTKDITPLNLHFLKTLQENNLIKIIFVRNVFSSEDLNEFVAQIATAELYAPIIPGDVEEVFAQIYLKQEHKECEHGASPGVAEKEDMQMPFKIEIQKEVPKEAFRIFEGKSVLIVEDNEVNQKILSSILEAAGIEVYKAENGKQALNILNRGTPVDLVFMDMNMPVMDGFEATKRIKDEPMFKGIPVIAVTGLGFFHEVERMKFVGVDACIMKPFKLGQLYAALERYMAKHSKESLPQRTTKEDTGHYLPSPSILDVSKGIHNVHNPVFYQEILEDVKETLEGSEHYFPELIYQGKIDELQAFCRDSLSLVETIGAQQMAKIFKEILVFISVGERTSLVEYIPLYQQAWRMLEEEMERYLGMEEKV